MRPVSAGWFRGVWSLSKAQMDDGSDMLVWEEVQGRRAGRQVSREDRQAGWRASHSKYPASLPSAPACTRASPSEPA